MRLRHRLAAVVTVLLVGFVLATPFRKTTPSGEPSRLRQHEPQLLSISQPALTHLSLPIAERTVPSAQPGRIVMRPRQGDVATAGLISACDTAGAAIVSRPSASPPTRPLFPPAAGEPPSVPTDLAWTESPARATDAPRGATFTTPNGQGPRWHRVVDGDSLPQLAADYLGAPELALVIFDANRDVLDSPHILPIGVELRIPARAVSPPGLVPAGP